MPSKDYSNQAKLSRWARRYLFPFDGSEPKAKALVVKHRAANGKMQDIGQWELAAVKEDDWKLIAEEVCEGIVDDAEGAGGVQQYICSMVDADGGQISRLPLRVAAEVDEEDGFESEPATQKGLLAMFMRHLEAKERVMTGSFATILRASQEQVNALSAVVIDATNRSMDLMRRQEELISQQHERELLSKEAAAELENKQMAVKSFVGLLGPIVKKFTGVTPEGMLPPEVHELRSFLSQLTEEQAEGIKALLTPEQAILLFSIMEKDAARTEQPPPNSTGEPH